MDGPRFDLLDLDYRLWVGPTLEYGLGLDWTRLAHGLGSDFDCSQWYWA